jgi:hypothetical protein
MKKKKEKKRKLWEGCEEATFKRGRGQTFSGLKGSQAMPDRLLLEMHSIKGKVLGSEKDNTSECGLC